MSNPSEAAMRAAWFLDDIEPLPRVSTTEAKEARQVYIAEIIDAEFAPAIEALRKYAGIMEGNRQTKRWEPMLAFQQLAKDTLKQLGIPLEDDQ